MKSTIKKLPKSEVEIKIELSEEEMKPYLENAAKRLSEKSKIEGFRPGKASYDIVRARFGEHAILEEATDEMVRKSYVKALADNDLKTVGAPKVDIEKLAANNPFSYKAVAALVPDITLGKYKALGVKKEEIKIENKKMDEILNNLVKMQSKEVLVDRAATENDKAVLDMDMLKEGVPVEGGQAKDMAVFLKEAHYIPGFNKELVGLKKGDKKEFDLDFPKEHYQKHLSGAKIHFKVEVKSVFEIQPPTLDDEFAKAVGQKSLQELKDIIKKNLEAEAVTKNEEKWEIAVLNKIVDNSKFSDIPEMLINEETHRMIHELQDNISKQGITFEDYLQSIGKTEPELKLELVPQAIKRIKIALILREVASAEKIEVSDKEIMEEVEKIMETYKENPEAQKQLQTQEFTNYIKTRLENKKVVEALKKENK